MHKQTNKNKQVDKQKNGFTDKRINRQVNKQTDAANEDMFASSRANFPPFVALEETAHIHT